MSVALQKRLYTVAEYEQLGQLGFFKPGERLELIEGEVVLMSPIGGAHLRVLNKLIMLMTSWNDESFSVSVQNPLRLARSVPQPDLLLLRRAKDDTDELPVADDVLLLVEVCDTSYTSDREVKLPLYAAASIPEVWLVNLPDRSVEVFSRPDPFRGVYTEFRVHAVSEKQPLTFRGHTLMVEEVMKPVMNAGT